MVPSFLSGQELTMLREDCAVSKARFGPLGLMPADAPVVKAFRTRLDAIASEVHAATDIRADVPALGSYVTVTKGESYEWQGWHQDALTYYLQQDNYHYLNVYLPIWKPLRHKSNMNIVPYDTLPHHVSPDMLARLKGSGARRGKVRNGKTVLLDDENGGHDLLPFDLMDISFTPEMEAGDLLVMRGDMLHRTQDVDTDRVAVSFRLARSGGAMDRRRLGQLCLSKLIMITGRAGALSALYQRAFDVFEQTAQDHMRVGDFTRQHTRLFRQRRQMITGAHLTRTFCRAMAADGELHRGNLGRIEADVRYLLERSIDRKTCDAVQRGLSLAGQPERLSAALPLLRQARVLAQALAPDVPEAAPRL
jgi:hypothetical protein